MLTSEKLSNSVNYVKNAKRARKNTKIKPTFMVKKHKEVSESDKVFVSDNSQFVTLITKMVAVNLRQSYYHLDSNKKAIVSLGLNSIVDLSSYYTVTQAPLFHHKQWTQLQRICHKYLKKAQERVKGQH